MSIACERVAGARAAAISERDAESRAHRYRCDGSAAEARGGGAQRKDGAEAETDALKTQAQCTMRMVADSENKTVRAKAEHVAAATREHATRCRSRYCHFQSAIRKRSAMPRAAYAFAAR